MPGRPPRHPWGTLGALQGAVGAVLVPPGGRLGVVSGITGSTPLSWKVPPLLGGNTPRGLWLASGAFPRPVRPWPVWPGFCRV